MVLTSVSGFLMATPWLGDPWRVETLNVAALIARERVRRDMEKEKRRILQEQN